MSSSYTEQKLVVVLQIRIYALYSRSRRVLMVLLISAIVTAVSVFAILADLLANIKCTSLNPLEGMSLARFLIHHWHSLADAVVPSSAAGEATGACVVNSLPPSFRFLFTPLLAEELFLFAMACWKGVLYCRSARPLRDRLTMRLLKGSIIYFVV